MTREFRIFEVDNHGNKWFICSRTTKEAAKLYIKNVLHDDKAMKIFNEAGDEIL